MGEESATPAAEVMLAQEQAVKCRGPGIRKGIESAFGFGGETEGTLVLTNRRLIYVHGREKEEDIPVGTFSRKPLYFSDVEDLTSIPLDSASFEIPTSRISHVEGRRGEAIAPRLEVSWTENNGVNKTTEFVQQILGSSRRKNLNDWEPVIEKLMRAELKIRPLPPGPSGDSLEGRIFEVLGNLRERGVLTIEREVEEKYGVELEPDEVQAACEKLVALGLVQKLTPQDEDTYYRKASTLLGEDDLSA